MQFKTTVIFCISFFLNFSVFGQSTPTKQQTIEWLISKLNGRTGKVDFRKYTYEGGKLDYEYEYRFNFEVQGTKISGTLKDYTDEFLDGRWQKPLTSIEKYTFDVNDICDVTEIRKHDGFDGSLHGDGDEYIFVRLKRKIKLVTSNYEKGLITNKETVEKDYVIICIDFSNERDLVNRFSKAITELGRFNGGCNSETY